MIVDQFLDIDGFLHIDGDISIIDSVSGNDYVKKYDDDNKPNALKIAQKETYELISISFHILNI